MEEENRVRTTRKMGRQEIENITLMDCLLQSQCRIGSNDCTVKKKKIGVSVNSFDLMKRDESVFLRNT